MFALDGWVLDLVKPLHNSPFSDLINHSIRQLGTGQVQAAALLLLVVIGLALSVRLPGQRLGKMRFPWAGRLAALGGWGVLSLAVSALAATVLKVLIHRPRPWFEPPDLANWQACVHLAIHESRLRGFPSGESTTTFAVAWILAWGYPRLRWPLLGVAVIIAAARVVVGAHHPSDVWAGAMLGIAVAQWVTGLSRRRAEQGGAHQR